MTEKQDDPTGSEEPTIGASEAPGGAGGDSAAGENLSTLENASAGKFEEASKEDVVRAYQELQAKMGQMSSEVEAARARQEADSAIAKAIEASLSRRGETTSSQESEEDSFEALVQAGRTEEAVAKVVQRHIAPILQQVNTTQLETKFEVMRRKHGADFDRALPKMLEMAEKDPSLGQIRIEHLYKLARESEAAGTPQMQPQGQPQKPIPQRIPQIEGVSNPGTDQEEQTIRSALDRGKATGDFTDYLRKKVGHLYEGMFQQF